MSQLVSDFCTQALETRASLNDRQVALLEETNVGPHFHHFDLTVLCTFLLVRGLLRTGLEEEEVAMNLEYLISGLITASLLVYLTYALLKPEKF